MTERPFLSVRMYWVFFCPLTTYQIFFPVNYSDVNDAYENVPHVKMFVKIILVPNIALQWLPKSSFSHEWISTFNGPRVIWIF